MTENKGWGWGDWGNWKSKLSETLQVVGNVTSETLQVVGHATTEGFTNAAEATKSFIAEIAPTHKQEETIDESILPWVLPDELKDKEESVKKQILLLSEEKWNFLAAPQEDSLKDWVYEFDVPTAMACLKADPKLDRIRFLLVPYKIKEEQFWYNYFARIHIIKSTLMDPATTIPKEIPLEQPKPVTTASPEKLVIPAVEPVAKTNTIDKLFEEEVNNSTSREQQLKKELEELGEDFPDLDLDLDMDGLEINDAELDQLLNSEDI